MLVCMQAAETGTAESGPLNLGPRPLSEQPSSLADPAADPSTFIEELLRQPLQHMDSDDLADSGAAALGQESVADSDEAVEEIIHEAMGQSEEDFPVEKEATLRETREPGEEHLNLAAAAGLVSVLPEKPGRSSMVKSTQEGAIDSSVGDSMAYHMSSSDLVSRASESDLSEEADAAIREILEEPAVETMLETKNPADLTVADNLDSSDRTPEASERQVIRLLQRQLPS